LPPQEPDAEQEVVFELFQEMTVLWPCWMLDRLALIDRLGAAGGGGGGGVFCATATPTVRVTFPPAPLHVKV
jgi:hypothetical protein